MIDPTQSGQGHFEVAIEFFIAFRVMTERACKLKILTKFQKTLLPIVPKRNKTTWKSMREHLYSLLSLVIWFRICQGKDKGKGARGAKANPEFDI